MSCRAHEQEKERGLIFYETDFWIETGLIQKGKRKTKFRTTTAPELIAVNSFLIDMACQRALARYGSELSSEEARCQRTDLLHASRSTNTDWIDDDGILMLGSGRKCKKAESRLSQKALSEHLRYFQTNAWSSATPIFKI